MENSQSLIYKSWSIQSATFSFVLLSLSYMRLKSTERKSIFQSSWKVSNTTWCVYGWYCTVVHCIFYTCIYMYTSVKKWKINTFEIVDFSTQFFVFSLFWFYNFVWKKKQLNFRVWVLKTCGTVKRISRRIINYIVNVCAININDWKISLFLMVFSFFLPLFRWFRVIIVWQTRDCINEFGIKRKRMWNKLFIETETNLGTENCGQIRRIYLDN